MADDSLKIPQAVPVPPPVTLGPAGRSEARAAFQRAGAGERSGMATAADAWHRTGLDLQHFARELERYVPKEMPDSRLQIDRDDVSGLFIYRSIDRRSGEVLKQYPTEEMLKFISYYREREGLVLDDNV